MNERSIEFFMFSVFANRTDLSSDIWQGDVTFERGHLYLVEAASGRGKNSHVHAVPKGATPAQYAKATGLEALFGALYLAGQTERLNELFHAAIAEE